MEKTTLYLTADIQSGLREAARRSGRPQAELVREALRRYLAEQRQPLPGIVGFVDGGLGMPAAEAKRWARRQMSKDLDRRLKASRRRGLADRR